MVANGQMSREDYVRHLRKTELSLGHLIHEVNKTKTVLGYRLGARTVPDLTFYTQADMWTRFAPTEHLIKPVYSLDNFPVLYAHDFLRNPPPDLDNSKKGIPLTLRTVIDWPVKLPGQSKLTTLSIPVSTQPDDYFAHQQVGKKLKPFFIEHDEGTETILPSLANQQRPDFFSSTSLLQKLLIYLAYWRAYRHVSELGIQSFEVIIKTRTPERADRIIEQLAPILLARKAPPNFVRVTDDETAARYNHNPYHPDYIHLNLKGDYVHLLDV